jgi:hypothetical protein
LFWIILDNEAPEGLNWQEKIGLHSFVCDSHQGGGGKGRRRRRRRFKPE